MKDEKQIFVVVADFGNVKIPKVVFSTKELAENYIAKQGKSVAYFIRPLKFGG